MQKNYKTTMGIVVAGIVLLSIVIWALTPNRYDWTENYRKDQRQPYDTEVLHELLQTHFPDNKFTEISRSFEEELPVSEELSSYVFVGEKIYLKDDEAEYLLAYADRGNDVFIAAKRLPLSLLNKLDRDEDIDFVIDEDEFFPTPVSEEDIWTDEENWADEDTWGDEDTWADEENWEEEVVEEFVEEEELTEEEAENWEPESEYDRLVVKYISDSISKYNYVHDALRDDKGFEYKHAVKDELKLRNWQFFDKDILTEAGIEVAVIGELNDENPNFIRISYGEGHLYLHTSPYAFTNLHLLEEHKLEYAGKVFSHLEERDIYWDQKSIKEARMEDIQAANSSALTYILSQKSLRWSWYLLLSTVLLYVLFRAKREQRIIPVLAGNTNTSLEFINTIGRLYFLKNDHRKLSKRKMQLFLAYVRDHYKIPTLQIDREMKERLASKAEVPLQLVEDIFLRFQRLDRAADISSDYLVNFHQSLEQFYKKCK